MTAPYATVLLPTYDRHATLEHALASGQAQTVAEIEILVACDGATAEVVEVALEAAADDSRVRVLELPKGHNNGGVARAKALEVASSDRILVLQDDDLWFPDHVETLGAALDGHDVVTAGTLAVRASGTVTAWVSNYGSSEFRRVARDTGYKLVFEAHYGFSLESYRRLDVRWERVAGRDNIKTLLNRHLAEDGARWASITAPTALSFNSPVSEDLSFRYRADELDRWRRRIESGLTGGDVMSEARWGGALWRGMDWLPAEPTDDLAGYLARLGLSTVEGSGHEHGLVLPLSAAQIEHLDRCFRFVTGRAAEIDDPADVVLDLMEPFAGPTPRCWAAASILIDAHGVEAARMLAESMVSSVADAQRGLARGLLASVEAQAQNPAGARTQLDLARAESPYYRAFFDDFAAKVTPSKL